MPQDRVAFDPGPSSPRARWASIADQTRLEPIIATSAAKKPTIPPPAARTTIVTGTATTPVTRPTIDAWRQRCRPISRALGIAWAMPNAQPTPASTQAAAGSSPSRAAAIITAPPNTAPASPMRQLQVNNPRAAAARLAPTVSPTKRISIVARPPPNIAAIARAMKAM